MNNPALLNVLKGNSASGLIISHLANIKDILIAPAAHIAVAYILVSVDDKILIIPRFNNAVDIIIHPVTRTYGFHF